MARGISLALELSTIGEAIDAARLLADEMSTEQFGHEEDFRRAPRLIEGVLALAVARVDLLQRAIRGGLDPRQLTTAYNRPWPPSDDPEQQDVVLESWSPERRAQMAKAELRRARKAKGSR